jgi:DNA-binding NarL/FixJ family response regulator
MTPARSEAWGVCPIAGPVRRVHAEGMPGRVLIVDDDPAFRRSAATLLAERGYRVVGEADNLEQARAAIARARPDALLLDVNLPDGDGIAFAQELTAADHGVRVLLTSSDAGAAPRRLLERSGAAGFVAKVDLAAADVTPYLG